MDKQNNVDEFFEKLPEDDKTKADIFEQPKEEVKTESKGETKETDPEEVPESIKDRRHRRLEARLQAERESNIELNARLQERSEMDRFSKENEGLVDPNIAKMFDASDAGKQNALFLSESMRKMKESARDEAIKEIEQRQENQAKEQKKAEDEIDNELESLEDTYNVDLTSDSPKARKARRELLTLIQEVSPKDEAGDIIGYADFDTTFKLYQNSQKKESPEQSRREEIASRSMQRSGNSTTEGTTKRTSRGFDGWRKDYNL